MSDTSRLFSLNNIVCPNRVHRTWAGTFKCRPEKYFQPTSINEIVQIVKLAKDNKKTIMLTGSGHSPSKLTMSDSWMVNLDKFNRVLAVEPHKSGIYTDVTVEAGIRIFHLNEYLDTVGLAIQNLGSISDQSAAGIISTGTHGSSAFHGLVSQQIVNITLLTASGELIECSAEKNSDLFRAAMLSVGKLGIVIYMTFRTIPAFNLKSVQQVVTFDEFLDIWPDFWTSSEFARCWWFPYSKKCVLWKANKTEEPLSPPRYSFYGTYLGRLIYESLLFFSVKLFPRLTPAVERWLFNRQYGGAPATTAVQKSVDALNMDCLYSQFVNEWSLPLTSGLQVLREIEQVVGTAAQRGEYFVHAPIEVRISNTTCSGQATSQVDTSSYMVNGIGAVPGNQLRPLLDTTPMLPYAESIKDVTIENLTLYINATMYRPFGFDCPIGKWYNEFEHIVREGNPHWAKNFVGSYQPVIGDGQMRGIKHKAEKVLGSDLVLFKELRNKYDPDGVFLSGRQWAEINGLI